MEKTENKDDVLYVKEKVKMAFQTLKKEGLTCVVHFPENKQLPYVIRGLYLSSFEYLMALIRYRKDIKKHAHKDDDNEIRSIDKELEKVLNNIDLTLLGEDIRSDIRHLLEGKDIKTKKKKK